MAPRYARHTRRAVAHGRLRATTLASIMWCPSVSLSVWANAWLAGHAAPDDVLDALSLGRQAHSVIAYDAVAAGRTGLPWPDVDDAGAMSLLQTLRTAAGRAATIRGRRDRRSPWRCRCPATSAACRRAPSSSATPWPPARPIIVSAVRRRGDRAGARLRVRRLRRRRPTVSRTRAVRAVVDGLLAARRSRRSTTSISATPSTHCAPRCGRPPRRSARCGRAPGRRRRPARHWSSRCSRPDGHHRVARPRPDARAAGAGERRPRRRDHHRQFGTDADRHSRASSEAQIANDALRPLAAVVRSARLAAVSAILQSAWRLAARPDRAAARGRSQSAVQNAR